jgi:hypothetical protein
VRVTACASGKSLVVTWAFSRSRSRRTKTDARYSWQEARAHDRINGYCRAQKAGGDSLNLALHTAAFDGDAQRPMERAVAATRKPHAHRITRVTNASGIEFRNQQRRDEQRGEIMASCGSAPGLKSGNGGIKIQVFPIMGQCTFRKIAEIRRQSVQEVSGHFGMP